MLKGIIVLCQMWHKYRHTHTQKVAYNKVALMNMQMHCLICIFFQTMVNYNNIFSHVECEKNVEYFVAKVKLK